jgi:glyoxylase-like metal-dependent hydrolase (beta-lactamase superfamily II)
MKINALETGSFGTNCYVVEGANREALVIDPGADPEYVLEILETNELKVVAYPLTHGHIDHLGALGDVHRRHPAPIGMHPADIQWAFSTVNQMPPFYPPPPRNLEIERLFREGQEWTDAGLTYRVIETPGHTPGGVCFYFAEEGVVIAGDTLFKGSVGRTDLPGGDARTLSDSLKKLAVLPDDTRVYPGHGPATTIGEEKATNFFLRSKDWS